MALGLQSGNSTKIEHVPCKGVKRSNASFTEDEFFIARDLAKIVTSLGHRVIARARTHAEARAAAARQRPGLVLADVHLADGSSGVDAVTEIVGAQEVPVIFITAYPDRLLTGLRPEPTFLISKPYRVEEVKAVVAQSLFFDQKAKLSFASREALASRSTAPFARPAF